MTLPDEMQLHQRNVTAALLQRLLTERFNIHIAGDDITFTDSGQPRVWAEGVEWRALTLMLDDGYPLEALAPVIRCQGCGAEYPVCYDATNRDDLAAALAITWLCEECYTNAGAPHVDWLGFGLGVACVSALVALERYWRRGR